MMHNPFQVSSLLVLVVVMAWQSFAVDSARIRGQFGSSSTGSECVDGATWKQDCNSYFCANGRAACTLKLCLPELGVSGITPSGNSGSTCPNIPDNLLCPADCAAQFYTDDNGCRACRCDPTDMLPYCWPYCSGFPTEV